MAQIDMGLLLLIAVIAVAVIGLILALQTNGGRKRLADAALRLAESLIARAIVWLEANIPGGPDVPAAMATGGQIDQARQALAALHAWRWRD
jgi:hypothetical protein